jgi:enoyl-CoA hydratase/carnithine racemase
MSPLDKLAQTQVLAEVDAGVAWLTLNRPHALNAMTEQMHAELLEACACLAGHDEVRVVIVTGAGTRAFCIGSDLAFLEDAFASEDLTQFQCYLERLNKVLFALEQLPIPTIAMVNGRARASGFELILCCDLVIVAEEAMIGDVHTPYGHIPGGGATQRAVRKLGWQKGIELLFSGRWLTGQEAVEYGLALRAVPADSLRGETQALAASFARLPGTCLRYLKHAALSGRDLPLREGVEIEVETYLSYLRDSALPRELFMARRRP